MFGVNDLIAAEGTYHNKCLNAFKYDTQKTKKQCETIDLAMIFLVQELGYLLPFSSGFKGFDLFLMSEPRITFSMAKDFL
jgi:hypothetical protein